jgi:dTDP-4-dehydrorhamnose 3,5-epimerase
MSDTNFITHTSIQGLLQIQRPTYPDDRGFFRESVRIKAVEEEYGEPFVVAQASHARSTKLALRGIHIAPWNKLIYITRGKIQTVIVDTRPESPTFGKYESFILGDDNRTSIFVPKGLGNSYLVLSDEADYTYLVDQEWAPNMEKSLLWNDETVGIKWELTEAPILSEKDKLNKTLRELFPERFSA